MSYSQPTDNVLLISKVQNKVVLPYRMHELYQIFNDNRGAFSSIQEIIDKKYTIPLDSYKIGFISRFKEAFTLMRNRENSSLLDALDLASELMFNSLLHPAIITACKDLDQLDIYLDCLDKNELSDFPFFQIKYELA